jgi:F-type H+-transporting ATPase subunit b
LLLDKVFIPVITSLGLQIKEEKAGMLELNYWFFVLLLNFLVLIYVLNIILFKPLVNLFTEREGSIKGSLDAAKEMNQRKEEAIAAMDRELKEARNKSNEIFESLRKEGMSRQKEILEGANKQAHDFIERAKAELKSEAEKGRQKLRSDVEKFSDEIVKKLVGA